MRDGDLVIGDLVRLSSRKTRRGFTYEDMVGLIVDMTRLPTMDCVMCSVNFSGVIYDLNATDLVIVEDTKARL